MQKKQKIKILIGIIVAISGIILMIYDWNTGSGHYEYAYTFSLLYFALLLCIIGVLIILYNRKSKLPEKQKALVVYIRQTVLYSFAYAILLAAILYGYSYSYIFPKIEIEGIEISAVVTKANKRLTTDYFGRVIDYEYIVNEKIYVRRIFNENFNEGDSVLILYRKEKPNFHVIKNVE